MFENLNAEWMAVDSQGGYAALALLCAMLTLYVMQMTWHDKSSKQDPVWAQWTRRSAFSLFILGLLWRAAFSNQAGYQPTLPEFMIVLAITLMFAVRAVILYSHRRDYHILKGKKTV